MKRVLVVVDYQKDFVDGALGFEKAKEIKIESDTIPSISPAIESLPYFSGLLPCSR